MKTDRTVRLVSSDKRERWDAAVSHPLQSWAWGDFRKSMHVEVVRLGVYDHNKLVNCWQISFHKIPYLPFTVGYFPKGQTLTKEMLDSLKEIGREHKAIFIQIEPDVTIDEPFAVESFKNFVPAHHPLFTNYTFVLDLTKSESVLLAAMQSKTRYNVRLASRKGVVVREDNSDAAFSAYLRLVEETTRRQGFYAHNRTYHKNMWKILREAGIASLFTASYENEIVTAWIVFCWKNTVYYPYGASSRLHREVMAPNLMLWEIVRWAKSRGYYYFDLWGALGSNPDIHDPWYGFHRFKEGYAPTLIEFVGSFDLIIYPVVYKIYTAADSLRWFFLRLSRR